MADDTYSRGYRNDHHDRGGAGDSAPAPDPLTELARLIGQSDPFATDRSRQPGRRDAQAHAQQSGWRDRSTQPSRAYDTESHDERYDAASEPPHHADNPYGSAEAYAAYQNGYAYPQAGQHEAGYGSTSGYEEQQPYHQDQQAYRPDHPAYPQDEQAYHQDDPAYQQDPQAYHQDQPHPSSHPSYLAQASIAAEQGAHGEEGTEGPYDAEPPVPGYPAPPFFGDPNARPDDYYEGAPAPRRGWMVTAAALVGLAVIGTAGAVAYRSVFTGGATRIITRDVGPTKITPAQTTQDSTTKPADRMASAGQNEHLGPPPEQPMPIPEPPRSAPPALTQSQPPAAAAPVLPQPPSQANPPHEAANPPARVVRTERIKPADQPGDADATRVAAPARASAAPAVRPPQPRVAAQNPNAPLSLAPQAFPSMPVAPPARPQHTTAVASTGPAVEHGSAGASGYYVQVSAQKSEEEAKSSFRGIQARHTNLLGGHQPFIRRKDLGAKGVFYGAQVGPFSREAAVKLCENLKAAGQSCMVQRN